MVHYKIAVKKGYLDTFVFEVSSLKEAGHIADIFLDYLVDPTEVDIRIEPYKREEEEIENE